VYNFLTKSNILVNLLNASLKDDNDIQRQVRSLYCAANRGVVGWEGRSHAFLRW